MAVRSEVSDFPTGEWGSFKWKTNGYGPNKSENQQKNKWQQKRKPTNKWIVTKKKTMPN